MTFNRGIKMLYVLEPPTMRSHAPYSILGPDISVFLAVA